MFDLSSLDFCFVAFFSYSDILFIHCSYGDYVHNLSVMTYINDAWLASNRMVKAARRVGVDDSSLDMEVGIWKNISTDTESVGIGEAWEDDSKAGDGFTIRGRDYLSKIL